MKKSHGGARTGAGKKKGTKWPSTLAKDKAREITREIITSELRPLLKAQIAHAKGISFLMVRDAKSGKFLRVGKHRAEALKPDEEIIEVWEKDPSVQAFTDLLNRAIDKPAEHIQVTGKDEGPIAFKWQG